MSIAPVTTSSAPTRAARIFWRSTAAVVAVGTAATLAIFGDQLVADPDGAAPAGTTVTVAAPSISLTCPQAVTTTQSGAGAIDVDGIGGDQATQTAVSVAAIGGQGAVQLRALPPTRDAETNDPTDPQWQPPTFPPLEVPQPAGNETPFAAFRTPAQTGAVIAQTSKRNVSSDQANEFTTATMTSVQRGGDLRGLSAASCAPAASEHWLVGGSTSVGTSSRLVIQNPSATPATVAITLWGPSGRVELSGSDTLLVPAGQQVSTLLEAIAPEQRRIAVHVESQGAQVSAYIQHSELEGVTPQGVDFVTGSSAPSTALAITGVRVGAVDVGSDQASIVRLVVPDFTVPVDLAQQSEEDAADVTQESVGVARLYLLGPDGHVVMFGAQEIELMSGQVQDVSLGGAPAGVYSVVLESDIPVIAAAKSLAVGEIDKEQELRGTPEDFAWSGASTVYSNAAYASRTLYERALQAGQLSDELSGRARNGAVALPAGAKATLSILGLPEVTSAQELATHLDNVPRVYSALAGDNGQSEHTDPDGEEQPWEAIAMATVTAYKATGEVAGTVDVSLSAGQSRSIPLDKFSEAASISVVAHQGSTVDWSVVVEQPDVSGSVGHISPVDAVQEPAQLLVTRSQQVSAP